MHETVRAELNARRRGTASTKTRGEVAMTGAKAWRQKGTGRARAGALSSPQRTGGGVAFGPKPRRYTVKVNRKARRRALRAALSLHAERGSLAVDRRRPSSTRPSTKAAAEALAELDGEGSVLVVLADERGRLPRSRSATSPASTVLARRSRSASPTSSAPRGWCSRRPRSSALTRRHAAGARRRAA